jgi:hypothetical protein
MAKTVTKPVTKKAKAPAKEAKPAPKKERAAKSEPEFSVADVWSVGRDFSKSTRSSLDDFASQVKDMSEKAEADPKTYRDHLTAIKFNERRVERITMSLDELDRGLKERKERVAKPKAETPAKKAKAKEPEPDEEEEDDEEDEEEDEEDDLDEELDD